MYLALYRKFRPKTFDGVIGQNHITTTLKNQIANGQISHAYLFCGTRGTGKTSVAKIFAQAINCEHNQNGSPCFECNTCKALMEPSNMDILEIDAASNNRVDEIRDLREKVKYPPVNGKYKVYIIDEVHMLTDSAFNALLKTLEEPPHHVVFILATTEVQKLPATILSRCLRFDFKLVSNAELEKHLQLVFEKSGVTYEKEALALLASLGEGSVRDTLSVADMVVAYSNKQVTYDAVLKAVGAIDKTVLFNLGKSVLTKNAQEIITTLHTIIEQGKNVPQIAKDLANYFRDLALVKTTKNYASILSMPTNLLNELETSAKEFALDDVLACLKAFTSLENEFRSTNNPRLLLEVTALNLATNFSHNQLLSRVEKLEKEMAEKKSPKIAPLSASSPSILKVVELFDETNASVSEEPNPVIPIKHSDELMSVFGQMEQKQTTKTVSKAQAVLGKMLVVLRQNAHFSLHSLLGANTHVSLNDHAFSITVYDEVKFSTLKKPDNLELLQTMLTSIENGLVLQVHLAEQPKEEDIVQKLSNLFGNLLTIE